MSTLVALFHNRWSVPILAELHRQRGSRFVTLARTLGMSRESLRRTLAALIESGLVGRNPGTFSKTTMSAGTHGIIDTQTSSMPTKPIQPNWLKPRKSVTVSEP